MIGERILRGIPFLQPRPPAPCARRTSGGTAPATRTASPASEIPLLSRIVFACDTWDVMTSDRPYRDALTADEAERRLAAEAGHQLDPQVVAALLAVVRGRRDARERVAA